MTPTRGGGGVSGKYFATEAAIEKLKKDIAKRGNHRIAVTGFG